MKKQEGINAQSGGDVITLLAPLAIMHTVTGALIALRIARCKVRCYMDADDKRKADALYILGEQDVQITEIISMRIQEISLIDTEHDKALRLRLFTRENYRLLLRGVNVITYVCEDGTVTNSGIYYPLISDYADITTMTRHRQIHGYWDYTGVWHEGIADVPQREPYLTEIRKLQRTGYMQVPTFNEKESGIETFLANKSDNGVNYTLQVPV